MNRTFLLTVIFARYLNKIFQNSFFVGHSKIEGSEQNLIVKHVLQNKKILSFPELIAKGM